MIYDDKGKCHCSICDRSKVNTERSALEASTSGHGIMTKQDFLIFAGVSLAVLAVTAVMVLLIL